MFNLDKFPSIIIKDFLNKVRFNGSLYFVGVYHKKEYLGNYKKFNQDVLPFLNDTLLKNKFVLISFQNVEYLIFTEIKTFGNGEEKQVNIFKRNGNYLIPIKKRKFVNFSNLNNYFENIKVIKTEQSIDDFKINEINEDYLVFVDKPISLLCVKEFIKVQENDYNKR